MSIGYTDPLVHTYKLIDYFDVLGNEEDGWEVNNLCTRETGLVIAEDVTDEELINFLIKINYLGENCSTENVMVEWMDETICELTQRYNQMPLGRLVMEERTYKS